jgi:hypothetical protein
MEPNKLENDFRKKLNDRTIQPSEMSWDRLDAMLSVAEKKKPKRTWLFIAASFLGFLLVGTIFFNQSEVKTGTENGVVIQEREGRKNLEENFQPNQNTESSNQTTIVKAEAIASNVSKQPNATKKNQKGETLAVQKQEVFQVPEKNEEIAVVAPNEVSKPNRYIESEKLLAEAETRIQSQEVKKYVAKSNVKVNSQSLLSSVEGELNDTFRERVIKSIGKNYETVKTSVANRNHE